jgi:hypothetical protein
MLLDVADTEPVGLTGMESVYVDDTVPPVHIEVIEVVK